MIQPNLSRLLFVIGLTLAALPIAARRLAATAQTPPNSTASTMPVETAGQKSARMAWWREARFGMFIHWGLYAIPAGQWKDQPHHGEWIMTTAQIPVDEYEKYRAQFNPVKFDARRWVQIAKAAGMKYITITSKHHDGFALFDSKVSDYDIMSTPFNRDILKELADACRAEGIKMCWYHSIMDWHHPDYLPRRDWEKRTAAGADFNRYVQYLKSQVRELLTNYGDIGVMWFDGEWEGTWTHEHGADLYAWVRALQPSIIVNNRVDKGRGGMAGMSDAGFCGDYGTPEQEIPATGMPGVDWETCMTMNDHWGFNKKDTNFKSTETLIHMLVDIASKGGNYLLNVGPTAEGEIPAESVKRLSEIGAWMKVNGQSIHGTSASPFKKLDWGRCTQATLPDGDGRLYLHVFEWPKDGKLVVPGIYNDVREAVLLAHSGGRDLKPTRVDDAIVLTLPNAPLDPIDTVIVLDVKGKPDVADPPLIIADADIFVSRLAVKMTTDRANAEVRYTTDGTDPTTASLRASGDIHLFATTTVAARIFRDGRAISPVARRTFTKVVPRAPEKAKGLVPGIGYEYYEGKWTALPDFDALVPSSVGAIQKFDLSPRKQVENFAFRYRAYLHVRADGVYSFSTMSDDGSRLYIGDQLVVDNDGLHEMVEKSGHIALAKGMHAITVAYFECTGGDGLSVTWSGPGQMKGPIAPEYMSHAPIGAKPQAADAPKAQSPDQLARPTPQQLAWHDSEIGMFIHFAPNTWTDQEYDDGKFALDRFNPTELDTDQWADAAQAMSAKYIVIVAKHAGGFCLWPTATTDYGVRNTPWRGGKGDIVGDLAKSCGTRGIRLGVYLSPCDKHAGAGGGGKCDTPAAQEKYNSVYRQQLTEVLSQYGEMYEVWFDGSIVVPVGDILQKYAPRAMVFQGPHATIRWVGNEDGVAPDPAWNALSRKDAATGEATALHGRPDGDAWLPNEVDARIRDTWFWNTRNAGTLKSLAQLMDMYYTSVGRGAVLLLNQTPDTSGRIPEADVRRGAEFAAEIKRRFDKPIAETTGEGLVLDVNFHQAALVDHVVAMEDLRDGERIRKYVIQGLVDGAWKDLAAGTAVGHKKIDRFPAVSAEKIRFRVVDAVGEPRMRRIAAYHVGP